MPALRGLWLVIMCNRKANTGRTFLHQSSITFGWKANARVQFSSVISRYISSWHWHYALALAGYIMYITAQRRAQCLLVGLTLVFPYHLPSLSSLSLSLSLYLSLSISLSLSLSSASLPPSKIPLQVQSNGRRLSDLLPFMHMIICYAINTSKNAVR